MSNKATVFVVIVICAVSVAANAFLVTRADRVATKSGRPIFIEKINGMFEYDWDPTDPDQSTKVCVRYQLRILAFEHRIDRDPDDKVNQLENMVKIVEDECKVIKARAERLRTAAEKYK